jgi:hypothetical protein
MQPIGRRHKRLSMNSQGIEHGHKGIQRQPRSNRKTVRPCQGSSAAT